MKFKIKQSVKDAYHQSQDSNPIETDEPTNNNNNNNEDLSPGVENILSQITDEVQVPGQQVSEESLLEQLTDQPSSDVIIQDVIEYPTFEEKKKEQELINETKKKYYNEFISQGEDLLYQPQEITDNLAKQEYDRARNEIIINGSQQYSIDTKFNELKEISPTAENVVLRGMAQKDNYDYVYNNIFTGREKRIADLQSKQRILKKQLDATPNDLSVIRMVSRNKAQLQIEQGEQWKPLTDENGEFIDKKWDRPAQKTQQIQQKSEEYKAWDTNRLMDLFNELVAKHKFLKDIDDKYIQPEFEKVNRQDIGALSALAGMSAFSMATPGTHQAEAKRAKLLEKGREIEDELEAISHALILNQDPASMKESWHGYLTRGVKSYIEESLGINAFATKSEMQESYASAVNKFGGKLTEAQSEELDRTVLDKSLMALGYTLPLMVELAASKNIVKGVSTAVSAGRYAKALKTAIQSKYGNTGLAFIEMLGGATEEAIAYSLAPSENISAEMGAAENITQKLLDFKFKGKKINKIGEFLTRTLSGMTAETVAEFSGDFAKALKDSDFNVDEALENTFGKTGDEALDNLLATMIMTGGFSTVGNLPVLTKVRNAIESLPDSEQKTQVLKNADAIIADVEQSKTEQDAREIKEETKEAMPAETTEQEELQQTSVRGDAQPGMETTEGEEVDALTSIPDETQPSGQLSEDLPSEGQEIDKFEAITSDLNIQEDVSDIVGEKSKSGNIDGAQIILDAGKDADVKLESISVPEEMRRQGIADKAMDSLTSRADDMDITIELDAKPQEGSDMTQEDLIDFYENHGFEFDGTKGIRKPTMTLDAESEMTLYDKGEFERGKQEGVTKEKVKAAKKLESTISSFKSKMDLLKEKAKEGTLQTKEAVSFIKDSVKKLRSYPYSGGDMVSLTNNVTKAISKANSAVKYINAKTKSLDRIKKAIDAINIAVSKDYNDKNTKAAVRKLNNSINSSNVESKVLDDVKTELNALTTDLESIQSGQEIMYNGQGYTLETILDGIKNDNRIKQIVSDIESDNTIRMGGKKVLFEEVLDEFSQSVDDLYEKGVKKTARENINNVIAKKRSRSVKGKQSGVLADADTIEYFNNVKRVLKGNDLLEMQLEAESLLSNNYPGTPEYEQGLIMQKAIEDFGLYSDMDASELIDLEQRVLQIDKEGREALKTQKAENAARIEDINNDIENNVDKSHFDIDAVSRSIKEIERAGITDADASFLDRMNAKMKAAKINTQEGIRNFFGKAIMQWSMAAETILSFVDINEKTFGTGTLINRTVRLVELARHNYLKGRYSKEFDVMSAYDSIFNGNTVLNNKKGIIESRKRFRKQASKWQLETINLPVLIDGKADIIKITKDQAMRVYAWSKNKDLQQELTDQFGLSTGDIEQLKIKLGENEVKFIDYIVDDFMAQYYNEINSSYRKLYYTNLPKVDSYFPIQRVGMKKEIEVDSKSPMSSIITATGASMLKNRQKSKARLELNDNIDSGFLSGLFGHINEAEHVINYGQTAKDISVALNNPYLRATLERYGVRDILNKQFRESITQDMGYVGSIPALNKVIDAYTLAALGAKLNMTMKQTTSFINAMSDYTYDGKFNKIPGVSSAMFMKDVAKLLNPFKARKLFNELYLSSPIFRERIDSYRYANADLITNASAKKPYKKMSAKEAIHSATMSPIRWGDQLGILYGYGAIYQNEIKNGKTKQEAIKAFEQYEKTQQTRSAIHLTGAQINKNAFSRLLTAFKSSSFQYFNQSFGSAHSIYRSMKREGSLFKFQKKDAKRLVVNHALTYALFQMVASLPKAFRDDDEYWEDVAKESLIGSADGMFFLSAFTEWLFEVGVKTYDHYSTDPSYRSKLKVRDLRFTLDVERPFNRLIRDLNKEESDKVTTAALFAAEVLGLPGNTAGQISEGVINVGDGDFVNGLWRILGYTDYVIGQEKPKGRVSIKRRKSKRK